MGIHKIIFKKPAISPAFLEKIMPVHSGFALNPCGSEARQTILKAGNELFLSKSKLEEAINWIPVIIPTVPSNIRKEQGKIEVSKSMLTDEIERVCSIRPAHVKQRGGNKAEAPQNLDGYFAKPPTASFRVFDRSGIARQYKKQQPLKFCSRDPHRSDSRICLARPTRSGAPTKEQIKTYRQAGEREHQTVLELS
ncbi:hypothetical protein EPUL_001358 [Erysiphe pulchra]|uniref:Uncharacterized protein n=1 Tax=Erysiphe pulchra TaxID=225359 RepID=A0A2S4PY71_9PEZI|nr:hypothetical protein EPUL_001358 [Erysiphe pulchra]